jgi:co-chaperonin GroES (HSP10)
MTVTLEPLGARVLVAVRPLPEKTGSFYRVDAWEITPDPMAPEYKVSQHRNEYARMADVLAVGPEVRDVEKGDVVVVSILAGQQIGDSILLPESGILARYEEEENSREVLAS